MNDLLELLERAGHADFRDARGPMGFTQRQASGKFTRTEAQEFIDQLEEAEDEQAAPAPVKPTAVKLSKAERALRELRTEDLVAELQRRGWNVTKG